MSRENRRKASVATDPPAVVALERRLKSLLREAVEPAYPVPPYLTPAELYDDWPGTRRAYPQGYPQDRKHGQNWPVIRNEDDLRQARAFSRFMADTNPLVIGFLDHITNFVVGPGFKWSVGLKGVEGETGAEKKDPAVRACQSVLDEFRSLNGWGDETEATYRGGDGSDDSAQTDLEAECWRSAMRDGEAFLRLFAGGASTNGVPLVRRVNPECVYCPPGETQEGPWSFGIETDPEDRQTRLSYHVADPDKYPQDGEMVSASKVLHLKLNVDSDVKRGVPDFWPLEKEAQHLRKLWQNMAEVTAILSAIAYIRQHAPGVSGTQIANMNDRLRSGTDFSSAKWGDSGASDIYRTFTRHESGTIIDITNGMQFQPPPAVTGLPGFIQGMQATLRIFGLRWGCPEYFSGDASNANFASTLVAGGPFERAAQRRQRIYKQWQQNLAVRVLGMAAEAGRLSLDQLARVSVKATPPAVAIANKAEDTSRRVQLMQAAGLSKRTVLEEEGYDPDREAANTAKEAAEQQPPQMPGDPGAGAPVPQDGPTPDQGGGEMDLSGLADQLFAEGVVWESTLVKKRITDKTGKQTTVRVRADADPPADPKAPGATDGAAAGGTTVGGEAIPDEVAKTVSDPGRLKRFGLRVASALFRADALMQKVGMPAIEAVFDTPSDLQKFGYAATSMVDAGRGLAGQDPIREQLGIGAHLAASLIGKAATAVLGAIKKKRQGAPMTEAVEGLDELVGLWREILAAGHELLGLPEETVPGDDQIRAGLEALAAKGQAPVSEAVEGTATVPPELLAAILQAYARGDEDAVAELIELAGDPDLLAAVLDGPPDEDAITEAKRDRSHLVFDKVKKRWVNPDKKAPVRKTPAGQLTPKEQLIARKQAAEPARQAAREAWAGAVADPTKITPDQLAGLAGHLGALTRDELRAVARGLQQSPTGLKRDIVDRLLAHVGQKPTGGTKVDITAHSDDDLRAEYERRFGKPAGQPAPTEAPKAAADRPAPPAAELERAVVDEVHDMLAGRHANIRMAPIHEIRDAIRAKFGDEAASPEVFNDLLLGLRRQKKLWLVSIDDRSRATEQQLKDSVFAVGETFFWAETMPGTPPRSDGAAASRRDDATPTGTAAKGQEEPKTGGGKLSKTDATARVTATLGEIETLLSTASTPADRDAAYARVPEMASALLDELDKSLSTDDLKALAQEVTRVKPRTRADALLGLRGRLTRDARLLDSRRS